MDAPEAWRGSPALDPPPPRPGLPRSETAWQLCLGGRPGSGWSRNPGQLACPGHLGPQSILGLERTHPKEGITWKGWSQGTCHVLWSSHLR